jgi:methoxymalonate biosynthesis acyl carrier protein
MPIAADLRERLVRLFAESLQIDVGSTDAELFETGVLDSLAFIELLALLREQFGVAASLDEIDLENFRSIDSIAAFVSRKP